MAQQTVGYPVRVLLFGSRLDDTARGGDVDLLIELTEPVDNPAVLSATLSARISRVLDGRKVDVLLPRRICFAIQSTTSPKPEVCHYDP